MVKSMGISGLACDYKSQGEVGLAKKPQYRTLLDVQVLELFQLSFRDQLRIQSSVDPYRC